MTQDNNKPDLAKDVAELTRLEGKFVADLTSGNEEAAMADLEQATAIAESDPAALEQVTQELSKGL